MDLIGESMKSFRKQLRSDGKVEGKGRVFTGQRWMVYSYDGKHYAVLQEVFIGNNDGPWIRIREIESTEITKYVK